jgi:hypothetical protein
MLENQSGKTLCHHPRKGNAGLNKLLKNSGYLSARNSPCGDRGKE